MRRRRREDDMRGGPSRRGSRCRGPWGGLGFGVSLRAKPEPQGRPDIKRRRSAGSTQYMRETRRRQSRRLWPELIDSVGRVICCCQVNE